MKCVRVTRRCRKRHKFMPAGRPGCSPFGAHATFTGSPAHIAHGNADVYLVGEQKKRFRDIVLPLCAAGTAGYISDQSAEERMGGILYFRSRYAIAPCLIAEQTLNPQRLVLGNFSQPMDLARFSKEHDLKVIRDYGGGVVLFERGSR